jgi:hypothetical protein
VSRLTARKAASADKHRLLTFRCRIGGEITSLDEEEPVDLTDPDAEEDEPYVREVEEYVQRFALKTAHCVLIFETEAGEIAGVAAFDRQEIEIGRRRFPGWRLEVIALSVEWRGKCVEADIEGAPETMKASEYVLRRTFQEMLALDPRRVVVVGRVHDDNDRSIAVCKRVALDRTVRESPEYWQVVGEADPLAGLD